MKHRAQTDYQPRRGFLLDKPSPRVTPKSAFLIALEESQELQLRAPILSWARGERIERALRRVK